MSASGRRSADGRGGTDRPRRHRRCMAALPVLLLLAVACDGWPESALPLPPAQPPSGAVARGETTRRAALAPPGPVVDAALLRRGEERYAISCTPCHGPGGAGDGPVVARGFPRPPPIAGAEAGRSMAAIAANLGGTHPFDDRITPRDRWAIARFVERRLPAPGARP